MLFKVATKFEPYDCQYWAAFYLSLRIALLSIFGITQSGYCISAFIQILFSAAGLPFGVFNKAVKGFQIIKLGIGLTVPLVYITMLTVYKVLPKTSPS